jgi:hypothetical protein
MSCSRSTGPTANPEGSFGLSVCNHRAHRMATGAPPAIAVSGAAAEETKNATPKLSTQRRMSKLMLLSCRFARRGCNVVGARGVLRLLCGAFGIVAGPLANGC